MKNIREDEFKTCSVLKPFSSVKIPFQVLLQSAMLTECVFFGMEKQQKELRPM